MDRTILSPLVRPSARLTGKGALTAKSLVLSLSFLWLTPAVFAQTQSQTEVQKLVAADGEAGATFGGILTVSGDRALVTANSPRLDDPTRGFVYMYERDRAGEWLQVDRLSVPGTVRFGRSLSMSGDRLLIGEQNNLVDTGEVVYVFEPDNSDSWEQVARLTASDAALQDNFGASISLAGDRALVGAPFDNDTVLDSGSVYVFERTGSAWRQTAKINSSNPGLGYKFGA